MENGKKFSFPCDWRGMPFSEMQKQIEEEFGRVYEAIESLRATRRVRVESNNEKCNQWCEYQGYQEHLPQCSRKGPTR